MSVVECEHFGIDPVQSKNIQKPKCSLASVKTANTCVKLTLIEVGS